MHVQQLGPYRIVRELGRGGMGAVYEGISEATSQPAAIKVLNPRLAVDEGFRDRFATEIETLKKLKHPNIVRLYGFGEQDTHLYYAMELVEGPSLEDELRQGRRYNWRETTQLGIKLARALKHAHDHGVIHRDLKPANLLLPDDNDVKLADFGIARLFGNTRLTSDGGLIGTAEYMAPEQADGRPVTYHCDLYSLGGVLFAMLAGRPPFQGGSLPEMLQFHRFAEPPSVSRFADDVPEELQRIIARLLSKDPQARGNNALTVARQLAAMEHALTLRGAKEDGPPENFEDSDVTAPDADETPHISDAVTQVDAAARNDADSDCLDKDRNGSRIVDPAATVISAAGAASSDDVDLDLAVTPAAGDHGASLRLSGESVLNDPAPRPALAQATRAAISRFTTVEEAERRQAEAERIAELRNKWLQVGLLAAALATVVGLIVYLTRPLSADALYERIETLAADESPQRLLEAEEDIRRFVGRFPDDPRRAKLNGYLEEIDLAHLERRMQRFPRQSRDDAIAPIQHDYLEAMSHQAAAPDEAIARLKAILAVYEPLPNPAPPTAQLLELTRRQLKRLEQQVQRSAPAYLAVIDASLKQAADAAPNDRAAAREIWNGIVRLYGDKPWAAERVATAQAALKANDAGH